MLPMYQRRLEMSWSPRGCYLHRHVPECSPKTNQNHPKRPKKKTTEMQNRLLSLCPAERPQLSDSVLNEIFVKALKLPSAYQPDRADIFKELYIANFISA